MNYLLEDFLSYCESAKDMGVIAQDATLDSTVSAFKKAMAEMDITNLDSIEEDLDGDHQIMFFDE